MDPVPRRFGGPREWDSTLSSLSSSSYDPLLHEPSPSDYLVQHGAINLTANITATRLLTFQVVKDGKSEVALGLRSGVME